MEEIDIIEESVEIIKFLDDETPVNLCKIEGWDELTNEQQIFLDKFFDNFPNDSLSSYKSGVPYSNISKWKKDRNFLLSYNFIKTLHVDTLAAIHYASAVTSDRIRGQVLKAMKAEGYEAKEISRTTQNLNITANGNMQDVIKALKN